MFVGTSFVTNILFLRLAMNWPIFASAWEKVERELAPRHRRISKYSLVTRFKIITAVIMVPAMCKCCLLIFLTKASIRNELIIDVQ